MQLSVFGFSRRYPLILGKMDHCFCFSNLPTSEFFASARSVRLFPVRLQLLLLLSTLALIPMNSARADGPSNRRSLFSGSAAEKADQKHRRGVAADREENFARGYSFQDAAELDTVDEILDSRRGGDFFNQYRGPFYLSYVYDAVPLGQYDEADSEKVAERAAVYQAATTFSNVIVKSALEPVYRRALDAFSWFKHYTSVKVRREGDGNLGVTEHGEREKPLMEFKLHVSMNNGIEPRINVGENCTLRYDVIRQDALVEFRHDF